MADTFKPLRLVFAGTPEFAARHLQALIDSHHDVVAVYTQPDRPAGRGKKLLAGPVKQLAQQAAIPVLQPESLKHAAEQEQLAALKPDALVVVAYGLILPPAILAIPALACINVHASLLPRWRGAAPIQRAIEAGDTHSGVTIMQMDAGLDTGPMLATTRVSLPQQITAGQLHDVLAEQGAPALIQVLDDLEGHLLRASPQPEEGVSYAHKIEKAEAELDWTLDATTLQRKINAFNPFPGTWTMLGDQRIKIWAAVPEPGSAEIPGTIVSSSAEGIIVSCGKGCLRLTRLQLPGGKPLDIGPIMQARSELFARGEQLGL